MASYFSPIVRIALTLAALTLAATTRAQAQAPLAQLQFDIVGVRLIVDPPALTVPKQIATQINTSLQLPAGATVDAGDAIAALTQGAIVEGTLRGPSIPPTRISARPGEPLPLPAFALPGDYFLDGIRLVKDGTALLDATAPDGRPATTIPIRVINEVFVTSVTSRPLSLDEIKSKGIVIDEHNFQTMNFQVAFNIDGQPFTIEMPVALPTRELLNAQSDRTLLVRQLAVANQQLSALRTALPPEFDRPGLNFSIAPMPFFPVLEDGEEPGFDIPPVTGLVVIPGNVAFLNQFFSVVLMVSNVAPDGTPLVLRNVRGTVKLPTGLDRVAGASYEQPGDDPLRLARIAGVGQLATVNVVQPGPDGQVGTADDIQSIPPQTSGDGEFLLEGLKEGGHIFDIDIEAMLDGLPSGPVRLTGQAAGAVFVRNPTFSVTLAHPRTVRSGEPYDIYATITNTSSAPANLVSVNLDPLGISGAQLLSDPGVSFESIAAGQAVTARFRLLAQQTGDVTASSFTGEADGGIRLFTGIGERGVPLAPNAIVLPVSANALPSSLVVAAQRVLGQAFSIATAPAEALPPGVTFVRRQTVIDRGLELAEAGQRLLFGEALPRVLQDLYLDWLGARAVDPGFDQLLRTTDAGRAFLDEIGAVIAPSFTADPFPAQQSFVTQALARTAPLTVVARGAADRAAPRLNIRRADGAVIDPARSTLPMGAMQQMEGPAGRAALAVAVSPDPTRYTIEAHSPEGGALDLGITIPSAEASSTQMQFNGIVLDPGGVVRVVIDLAAAGGEVAAVDRDGDGVVDHTVTAIRHELTEEPLQVVDVVQLQSSFYESPGNVRDPATYGLLVGVLFNKPTPEANVETVANYEIASNAVAGAALQTGGRLVYLYLQKPVGALVSRSITIRNVTDLHGHTIADTTMPIDMVLSDGARVFGQVREANGAGVPNAVLTAVVAADPRYPFTVAAIRTDAQGSFELDFVPRLGTLTLTAQHPQTRAIAPVSARIRGSGESLLLNPTFLGTGMVRGRVLAADGVSVVANATVALFPGSTLGVRGLQTTANELGEFLFTGVPVGVFTLRAIDNRRASGQTTGVLDLASQQATRDIVIIDEPAAGGTLVGRVFLSDGVTPAVGFSVMVGDYNRNGAAIAAVDQATTDESGSFAFAQRLPARDYDVVAVDVATGQLGTARAQIVALTTTAVSIVMEATGAVQGVVFNATGQPVAGALVAGGSALVTTDGNGFFRMEGVPAGRRTIEAGDPVSRRRGAAEVNVLPGQTVVASIALEARATITGRVLDANGNPVPRASVRIPQLGGFTFVIANNQGVFTFPDMPMGDYLLQAPGPSAESLIAFLESAGYDPNVAFTSGDGPGAPPAPPSSSDGSGVIAAYQNAVQAFMTVDESLLGLPDAQLGGFGWNRVRLFQDSVTQAADVRFLPQGTVAGTTVDAAGRPTGAAVRVLGLKPSNTGAASFGELSRLNSDAATGAFAFSGIARFDLATFQTAGVRGGDFTLEAATQFSPVIAQLRDQLNTANPNRTGLVLQFPSAAVTNGTASGIVLMPDGVTPAPAGTQVGISFGDLTVTTNAEGRFQSLLPIPSGQYLFTAQTPTGGLRGQSAAIVPAGGHVEVTVRLLGLGNVAVLVRRTNGEPVGNASVRVRRGTFPADQADGITDAGGSRRFVNLSEGPFSVEVEEAVTGLTGRGSGTIVRDAETPVMVTITASGRVTGTFLSAGSNLAIPFAQVTLTGGGIQAYTTTDAAGRFELTAIPIGAFTVEANDPASGRIGRAVGQMSFEGQLVDVTVLQLPRGTVAGYVFNADGTTGVAAASVELTGHGSVATRLQVSTNADGSFRIAGVSAGSFSLRGRDPLTGAEGTTTGVVTFEDEIVDRNVVLQPLGAIRISVVDEQGQPAPNANVTAAGRTAAVDTNGQFTFEHLPLGTYAISAVSLADGANGGRATASISVANEVVDATVHLRGVAPVTVRVVASDGVTPVSSARVTLNAKGAAGTEQPGPTAAILTGFTDGSGLVVFPSVPFGDYFARGESGPLGGVVTGTTPAINQASEVTIHLGASATIAGRVVLPDGQTPAARSLVTLTFQSQSGLQSGVLQITTDLTGQFQFNGIPLGPFSISAFEVVSNGVRTRTGALTLDGELANLGDLVLDNAGPRVASIVPAPGAAGVLPSSPVIITFSEPMLGSSISTSTIALLDGATAVAGNVTLSTDRRVATFTPQLPLRSNGVYSVTVRGVPDGPRDESNIAMVDAFVSSFAVRDVIPPVIVSTAPAADAREITPDAVIRVAFSEPLSAATVVLRTAAGAIVPAQSAFSAGSTVLILSPIDFLPTNASYTATVSGVIDTAGNPIAGGPAAFTFHTVDTIAPLISAVAVQGVARAGATVTLVPTFTGSDIARVEYVFGTVTGVAVAPPFSTSLPVPAGLSVLNVSARAVDFVGNRSEAFTLQVPLVENLPPSVQLINVSTLTVVPQGAALQFDVVATDDAAVSQILLSSVGAVTQSFTESIAGAPLSATRRFTVNVPAGAQPGAAFTIQAAAIDDTGAASSAATLALSIRDGVAPTVTIASPAAGTQAIPGETLTITVDAADGGGLTAITLTCNPVLAGCETRAVSSNAAREVFNVQVPASIAAPASITILASATDAAGNTGQGGRSFAVADVVAPQLAPVQAVSGSTRVLAGTTVSLRAEATDNVAIAAIDVITSGAVAGTTSFPVMPPVTPAVVPFTVNVPAAVANGAAISVAVRARDAAGNASNEQTIELTVGDTAAPELTVAQPPDGAIITPGQPINVSSSAIDDVGVARIVITASGAVSATETQLFSPAQTPAQATVAIATTTATPAGAVTITVQAFDDAGNGSIAVTRSLTIRDAAAPAVSIVTPEGGSTIDPRQPLTVRVQAADAAGVAEVSLTTSGALAATTSRPIAPAATSVTEDFQVLFESLPIAGGQLTLSGTARDGAGNEGLSAPVTVMVADVVSPNVVAVVPPADGTGVDPLATIALTFSEPIDRATISAASVRLSAGATPIAGAVSVSADDRVVTLTPASPLAINTVHIVSVDAAVRDRNGNALTPFASTFRTASPDVIAPSMISSDPADGAVGIGTTAALSVTFSEPIAAASVTPASFRVTAGGVPATGSYSFSNGGATVSFLPAPALPFESVVAVELNGGITDVANNALVNSDGSPITTPITLTYLTGAFAIVEPVSDRLIEGTRVRLQANGAASLSVASVVFSINGVAQPAITTAPFEQHVLVPLASQSRILSVVASARTAGNTELARAERQFEIVPRLHASPGVLGIARGATATATLLLSEPADQDLAIDVAAVDSTVATVATPTVVLPAGATSVNIRITACAACPQDPVTTAGDAAGNTAIVATSARGVAVLSVSVSDPVSGRQVSALAPAVGAAVILPASAGQIVAGGGQQVSSTVTVLTSAAEAATPVTITSSNPAVASATAAPIAAGSRTTTIDITTGQDGVAVLVIRVGNEVRSLTVFVGAPPVDRAPIALAPAVGIALPQPPSAGQLISAAGRVITFTIAVLDGPHSGSDLPVSVASNNSAIATGTASAIRNGERVTTLTVTTGVDGTARLTIRAGSVVREVTVIVGTPAANVTPIALAPAVGISMPGLPFIGQAFAPIGHAASLGIALLSVSATTDTVVTVSSSNNTIATVSNATVIVPAGSRVALIDVVTGVAGTATLTLEFNGERREFIVLVDQSAEPSRTPVAQAAAVGVSVVPTPGGQRLFAPAGTAMAPVVAVQLLNEPRAAAVPVTITSSDPAIASFGGSAAMSAAVDPGTLVVAVPFVTTGQAGAAILTFEFDGQRRELLLVVGEPPAADVPAVAAPVIGVRVQ